MIRYTRKEELWNTWSHAAGILLGVVVGMIGCRGSIRAEHAEEIEYHSGTRP